MTDNPVLVAADRVDPAALHGAFMQAFADYLIGPFALAPAQWPGFLARQGVDLGLSRVAVDAQDRPLAFAFVAPRPVLRRWRLATMGAVPAARGLGAAPALLADLAARARTDGQRALELEVFAQNPRALALYRRHGYVELSPLHGHDAPALEGAAPEAGPAPVARADALDWLARAEAAGTPMPLQLGATVLAAPGDWTAWRRGSAQLVFGDAPDGRIVVRSLVDTDPAQHDAEALARALRASAPSRAVTMPPLLPPALGGEALARAGFARQALHQLWMRCELG